MEKIIDCDGISVKFRATAATPRIYRELFGRDLFADMSELAKNMDGHSIGDLSLFENIAYTMAYHAAKADGADFPATADEWLDSLNMLSIYEVFPQLLDLWGKNSKILVAAKKKKGQQSVR